MNNADYPTLEFCKKLDEYNFPDTKEYFSSLNGRGCVCPSIPELLHQLPKSLVRKSKADNGTYSIYISHDDIEYTVSYQNIYFTQGTLPNALAEMWIWLKENDYLTK